MKYTKILFTSEQCEDAICAIECWLTLLEDKYAETGGYLDEIKRLEHIVRKMKAAQAKNRETVQRPEAQNS